MNLEISERESARAAGPSESPRSLAAGVGLLRFTRSGSRTVLQQAYATSPLKFLNPRAGGRAGWIYTATYGGGLVGGDSVRMTIDVEPGAYAVVTTQSSTKVYRSARSASHSLISSIKNDALLVVAPDPTVCFAGSSFHQEQRYELEGRASLVVVDWITCGRRAMGERWVFDRYAGRLEVRCEGRKVLHDSVLLSSENGAIADRMGRFNVWGTVVLLGPLASNAATAAIEEAASLPVTRRADLIVSAGPLGNDGALLRIAGQSVEQVGAVVRRRLGFLHSHLGDHPWGRKW